MGRFYRISGLELEKQINELLGEVFCQHERNVYYGVTSIGATILHRLEDWDKVICQ